MNDAQVQSTDTIEGFFALERLMKTLEESGLSDETRALLFGQILRELTDKITFKFLEIIPPEKATEISAMSSDEEKKAAIDKIFQENLGMTASEYKEKITEDLVQDFEAQE